MITVHRPDPDVATTSASVAVAAADVIRHAAEALVAQANDRDRIKTLIDGFG